MAAVIGARAYLPESRGQRVRLDLAGLVLVSAGVSAVIWGLVAGTQDGWSSPPVLATLSGGAVLLAGFLGWEARTAEPMIPPRLFRNLSFSAAVATGFLLSAALLGAVFLTSEFFQFGFHDSPLSTGLRFLPWTAAPLVSMPTAGAISDRVGARALLVPGLLLQAGGFAWIVVLAGDHAGYPGYIPPLIVAGISVSLALATAPAAALNALPPESLGKGSAVFNSLRLFGWVCGVAVVTAVFNARGSLATPAAVTAGYRPALAVAAGFSLLAAIVGLAIGATKPAATPPQPRPESDRIGAWNAN